MITNEPLPFSRPSENGTDNVIGAYEGAQGGAAYAPIQTLRCRDRPFPSSQRGASLERPLNGGKFCGGP